MPRPSHSSLARRTQTLALICSIVLILICFFHEAVPRHLFDPAGENRRFGNPPHPPPEPPIVTKPHTAPEITITLTSTVIASPLPTRRALLNGPPTNMFKDNLRSDVQYITSWQGSGFTNDVLSFINLLYLARTTGRVAILPSFSPTHVAAYSKSFPANLDFGEAFDLPRFTALSGIDAVEWGQVKNATSDVVDVLGCWNLWQAVSPNNKEPHYTRTTVDYKLDISYTIGPSWIKQHPDQAENTHMRFSAISSLAFPSRRNKALAQNRPAKSPTLGSELVPDEQLLCFDTTYWASELEGYDWSSDYSPAWRHVSQYLHYHPRVESLAQEYLRRMFGLAAEEPIPPFVVVHARRGDFALWCKKEISVDECLPSIATFAKRVEEMKANLLKEKGISIHHVVMTSNERKEIWWDEVAAQGWFRPDHNSTREEHGVWYPILVDGALQAMAKGIVGTDSSTVSQMSAQRIKSWNNGLSYMVKWGHLNADD
ncbi:hypothetical protein MKEN_00109800 [Mycena kentingensis (nom. inval.)]|nr:hypothetical protein MKEN_00109800 [Mycena kentingensis (nom. inval.)]